jgi:hypothetical protein
MVFYDAGFDGIIALGMLYYFNEKVAVKKEAQVQGPTNLIMRTHASPLTQITTTN